ncbi:hypothetical protein BHU72_11190 [Desulfuribacillus stibiiarsenatis]|uniref:CAAX prenyl protease 2/Lysostaphin resistance protein A-like domain-containing protein n=1 Tax=Desulfuribacillus stibiiarsenatis TaxID=1390249 RepID=A0A1E5L2K7_9FIRM|nr:CPBP family intramembrane glutamic endopeptidase [Desulfuribacillus stibiiarsenatis]OEH84360.1 hypothetical protein BHU72_11190 [Desulfuribacillus stibiiarsenatis]
MNYRRLAVFQNTFFLSMILIVVLMLTLLTAIAAVLYLPTSIGEQPQSLFIDEMYYFADLPLSSFDYLQANFHQGGFIVPAYTRLGNLRGVGIIGSGTYDLSPEGTDFSDHGVLQELYIPMNEEKFAMLLLSTNTIEISNQNEILDTANQAAFNFEESHDFFNLVRSHAYSLIAKETDLYVNIRLFGYQRVFTPNDNVSMALLHTEQGEYLAYYENRTVSLKNITNNQSLLEITHPFLTDDYPHRFLLVYAYITLTLLLISSIIVVLLLTIDLEETKRFRKLHEQIHYSPWMMGIVLGLYFISQIVLYPNRLDEHWRYIITICLYLLIVFSFSKNRPERHFLGLSFHHWGHSISSALALGFFFQMLGSFNVPIRFSFGNIYEFLIMFAAAFIFQALISELIFRSLIQNMIERYSNTLIAIIATAGVVAASNWFANQFVHHMSSVEVLIQSFLIAPFGSVILSLLYIRTRSILASSLLATLLIILPRILVY